MDLRWGMPDIRSQDYDHPLNFLVSTPRMENHQLYETHHLSFSPAQYPWYTDQIDHDPGVPPSAQVTYVPTTHSLGSWSPSNVQPNVEVSCIPSLPTEVDEKRGNHTMSAFHPAFTLGQDATHWDSRSTLDPPKTLSTTLEPQPLFPLLGQATSTLWNHFPTQSNAMSSSSNVTHSHHPDLLTNQGAVEPSTLPQSAQYQPFSPLSPLYGPHHTSIGVVETDSHPHISFCRVVHPDPTRSSHRRRIARAIECDGLWIDEDDLLRGLMAPNGKLDVHQCHWEGDHSPCYLWISGDKSSINAHMQKWHGVQPGGDKLQVVCRWCACGRTMLKDSIARHIVSIHLEEMWECQGCGKSIARSDAYGRHAVRSNFEACKTSGALITYSADAREVNARVALRSGGRIRYTSA